ncbi:MAG: putative alpha glycosidase [Fibrobacteres bacterium]|nr:putative alpha glycosidase [Fibrobacterota bacterium]
MRRWIVLSGLFSTFLTVGIARGQQTEYSPSGMASRVIPIMNWNMLSTSTLSIPVSLNVADDQILGATAFIYSDDQKEVHELARLSENFGGSSAGGNMWIKKNVNVANSYSIELRHNDPSFFRSANFDAGTGLRGYVRIDTRAAYLGSAYVAPYSTYWVKIGGWDMTAKVEAVYTLASLGIPETAKIIDIATLIFDDNGFECTVDQLGRFNSAVFPGEPGEGDPGNKGQGRGGRNFIRANASNPNVRELVLTRGGAAAHPGAPNDTHQANYFQTARYVDLNVNRGWVRINYLEAADGSGLNVSNNPTSQPFGVLPKAYAYPNVAFGTATGVEKPHFLPFARGDAMGISALFRSNIVAGFRTLLPNSNYGGGGSGYNAGATVKLMPANGFYEDFVHFITHKSSMLLDPALFGGQNPDPRIIARFDYMAVHCDDPKAGFLSSDIGYTGGVPASNCNGSRNGLHVIQNVSGDIWGTAEKLRMVYRPTAGTLSDISAVVNQVERTSGLAKAGVMIRGSLAANSKQVAMVVTPDGVAKFLRRTADGGATLDNNSSGWSLPCWVRITRSGNVLRGYASQNGTSWTQIGESNNETTWPSTYYTALVGSGLSNAPHTSVFSGLSGFKGGEYFRIKNRWNGAYLYDSGTPLKYGNLGASDTRTQWKLSANGNGTILLNRSTGDRINIENQASYVSATSLPETFTSAHWTVTDLDGTYKRLENKWKPGQFLHVENLTGNAQCGVIAATAVSSHWVFEEIP